MDKPTPHQIKALERQIAHDQTQPVKSSEKRVKLDTSFDDAVRQMTRKQTKDTRNSCEDRPTHTSR